VTSILTPDSWLLTPKSRRDFKGEALVAPVQYFPKEDP
jgi:hypothetical protein